jgi:E3 ubiquitin-protein ligase XBAT32/33
MGNSFGCSASGERLVSAARDGDFQEAQALLACNPRLAKYSTFGVRNSPLHFSAMQGHNEVSSSMSLKPFFSFLCLFEDQTSLLPFGWRFSRAHQYNGKFFHVWGNDGMRCCSLNLE